MGDFGQRGECPECGRDIGLINDVLRYHKEAAYRSKDDIGESSPCPGSGKLPKLTENETAHRKETHGNY